MSYRIEADVPLASDWLPADVFVALYEDLSWAIATAIEGVDDPERDEVRVVDCDTEQVVWRSTDWEFE